MTKRSGRGRAIVAALATVLALMAPVAAATPAGAAETPVHAYRATPGDVASDRYTLKAGDADVFVAKYANRSNNRMHVARFASAGSPTLTVTNSAPITSVKIYPERYYPAGSYTISGNTVAFAMSDRLRYAIVQVNGSDPQLTIIDDRPEDPAAVPSRTAANVVDVSSYVTDTTGQTDQTAQISAAIDALYADPSKDTLFFPDGAYQYAGLELRGRTKPVTVYVDEGALLKNRIQPTMEAMEPAIGIWDSANITIAGRGVFDGNGFANYDTSNGGWRHDAATSQHQGGVMVVRSQNIVFDDTLMRDAKQWNYETHTAKNVTFNNIKGLTPYAQPWIDGLDLASGQHITVNGALTLGNDDTFASGHYNPSDGFTADPDRLSWDTEDSFDIAVNDHLGWSAGAGNGIRLGHAAYGHQLKDYTFTNVNYVGFSAGGNGITVQNAPDSGIRNYPRYESVVVRDSSFDTSKVGTNFSILGKSSSDPLDRIGSVVLDGVTFSTANPGYVQNVTGLTIKDLTIAGQRITRATQTDLRLTNVIDRDLDFPLDVAPVIAPIPDRAAVVGEHVSFPVSATDGDGDAVTVTADGLPAGAVFDGTTLRWTPTAAQAGTAAITFTATDARGATGTATARIAVTDPDAETVVLAPSADTDAQTWGTEETLNYGDNEHLRVMNFNDASRGPLGELYPGGQSSQDAKLTYLSFDVGDLAARIAAGEVSKAELSLTYFGPTKTALSGTDTLKVAAAAPGWIEGDGKTTPTTRANTIAGGLTWLNKPAVDTSTVAESAPFDVTAPGKVGNDSTYGASQKPVGSVATVDVTSLVTKLPAGQTTLSLAVNETKKYDLIFVSKEGAARNPNASGMAPRLAVTLTHAAPPPLDVTATAAGRCVAGKAQVVVTVRNGSDAAADAVVTTPWGEQRIAALAAGKGQSVSFATRSAAVDAATVSVHATAGDAEAAVGAAVPALTCR